MPSFRSKVLDALNIQKTTVKLQVNETFPKIYSEDASAASSVPATTPVGLTGNMLASSRIDGVNYAVSKSLMCDTIGPNPIGGGAIKQTLDVLGFVVGPDVAESNKYKNMYPLTTPNSLGVVSGGTATPVSTPDAYSRLGHRGGQDQYYTGFHALGGLYDSKCKELQHIRKSAMPVDDLDTMVESSDLPEHSHKDWPDNPLDQHHLLNENPYSDALYYHSMRLSFLLTGITIPDVSEKASNHRGMVRMLILRPRLPQCKMRWDGVANEPHINMAYPPHWDTDLFYSGKRTLGGRMNSNIQTLDTRTSGTLATDSSNQTHLTPTFGLLHHAKATPTIDSDVQSLHYGHRIPDDASGTTEDHAFTSYDILTAPINRSKYAVVVDKMVTLDTLHHGVASRRIENVVIPFNKNVKFPGRKQGTHTANQAVTIDGVSVPAYSIPETTSTTSLTHQTIDEPLNLDSRPIIMFLSMDQKISAQVTGYTTITEL